MPARLQDTVALANQRRRIARVLHHAVSVDQIERGIGERQVLAIGLAQIRGESLLREVLSRQRDGRRRQIHPSDDRAASREPSFRTPKTPMTPWETQVELPNINCAKCSLQVIQFMADHAYNQPGGYAYHHCADLQITADPAKPIDTRWPGQATTSK